MKAGNMNKSNLQDFTVFLKNSFLSPQTYILLHLAGMTPFSPETSKD